MQGDLSCLAQEHSKLPFLFFSFFEIVATCQFYQPDNRLITRSWEEAQCLFSYFLTSLSSKIAFKDLPLSPSKDDMYSLTCMPMRLLIASRQYDSQHCLEVSEDRCALFAYKSVKL